MSEIVYSRTEAAGKAEGDLSQWVYDTVCDALNSSPGRLKGWSWADHQADRVHSGPCTSYCANDLILRRESDGLVVEIDIDLYVYERTERSDDDHG